MINLQRARPVGQNFGLMAIRNAVGLAGGWAREGRGVERALPAATRKHNNNFTIKFRFYFACQILRQSLVPLLSPIALVVVVVVAVVVTVLVVPHPSATQPPSVHALFILLLQIVCSHFAFVQPRCASAT